MKKTGVVSIKQEGDVILIQPPYSLEFVAALKEAIPQRDRKWESPYWRVELVYLDVVRLTVSDIAQREAWEVLDYTSETQEAVEAHKQEIAQNTLDRHVEAVLAVFSKLPPRALRLVEWQDGYLTFELATFLENKDLFRELAQASLELYRPTILFGGSKRKFSHTFRVAEDERILCGLCKYARITPIGDVYGSHTNVEYFHVRELTIQAHFDDGVGHFIDERDGLWVGFPYQHIDWDISWSRESWQVACINGSVYRIFRYEVVIKKLIAVQEYQYANPGVGFAVARSHPSYVARFVQQAHIEEWFQTWGNDVVRSETLTASPLTKPHWYDFAWDHPADELLAHISFTRAGGPEMCTLLGWDRAAVDLYRQRIKQLKEQAAQRVIADMKIRSPELALPKLQSMTIKDLRELGAKWDIDLKKSWGKERMIQVLCAQAAVTEDVIGLTKRLEGK